MASFKEHFMTIKNVARGVLSLNLEMEQFLASMYMLQIPARYRLELERNLQHRGSVRHTFSELCINVKQMLSCYENQIASEAEMEGASQIPQNPTAKVRSGRRTGRA